MTKLILMDLDGVLVDLVQAHHEALNSAITETVGNGYAITEEEFPSYNGLPTKVKLAKLVEKKHLDPTVIPSICALKQQKTIEYIWEKISAYDYTQQAECLRILKEKGYGVGVCSNSVRQTVKTVLLRCNYMRHVDFYLSTADVKNPKPNPEIYLRGMIEGGVGPYETLIVEDSPVGLEAAKASGAKVCRVGSPKDVFFQYIDNSLEE